MAQLESRVVYTPHADATPEAELDALAAAYRFILDRAGTSDRTPNSGPVAAAKETHGCDAMEIKNGSNPQS
jgi:hypothetical protein